MQDSTSNPPAKQSLDKVIQIDQAQLKASLGDLVRQSVEDTLNGLLDAEADRLCGAKRFEHSADRVHTLPVRHPWLRDQRER